MMKTGLEGVEGRKRDGDREELNKIRRWRGDSQMGLFGIREEEEEGFLCECSFTAPSSCRLLQSSHCNSQSSYGGHIQGCHSVKALLLQCGKLQENLRVKC